MDIWVIWEYSASITVIGLLIWLIKRSEEHTSELQSQR